jgi:enoyl-CoA hydratase/carnithine racemase
LPGRPTVALINGLAVGRGLELAFACDFRLMSRDARIGLPEIDCCLMPEEVTGCAASPYPDADAFCWDAIEGRLIDAEAAHRLNIVHEVLSGDGFEPRGHDLASEPVGLSPGTLEAIKR